MSEEVLEQLPTPRFKVGDTAWKADTEQTFTRFPCPDCLDTGKWKLTTPAGQSVDVACQRCQKSDYNSVLGPEMRRIHSTTIVAKAVPCTIGGIEVKTHRWSDERDDRIRYFAGAGGGQTWYEDELFDSEAGAYAHAMVLAETRQAEFNVKPQQIAANVIQQLDFKLAGERTLHMAVWRATYGVRELMDNLLTAGEDAPDREAKMLALAERVTDALGTWPDAGPLNTLVHATKEFLYDLTDAEERSLNGDALDRMKEALEGLSWLPIDPPRPDDEAHADTDQIPY